MVHFITTPYLIVISISILFTKELFCAPYFSPSIVDDGEGYRYPSGYRPAFIPPYQPRMSYRSYQLMRLPKVFRNRALNQFRFHTRDFNADGSGKWDDPRDTGRPNIFVSMIDEPVVEIQPPCGNAPDVNNTCPSPTPPYPVVA